MADRRVVATGKDSDGDITKLCNSGSWGYEYKGTSQNFVFSAYLNDGMPRGCGFS